MLPQRRRLYFRVHKAKFWFSEFGRSTKLFKCYAVTTIISYFLPPFIINFSIKNIKQAILLHGNHEMSCYSPPWTPKLFSTDGENDRAMHSV